jgi:hypothetical protein
MQSRARYAGQTPRPWASGPCVVRGSLPMSWFFSFAADTTVWLWRHLVQLIPAVECLCDGQAAQSTSVGNTEAGLPGCWCERGHSKTSWASRVPRLPVPPAWEVTGLSSCRGVAAADAQGGCVANFFTHATSTSPPSQRH